ncbi:hypothetical protein D3C87_52220 [compost metagenome]
MFVWLDRTWLCQNLTTFHVFTLGTAQQYTNVVASLTLIQQFAEHFNTGTGGFLCITDTNDFDFFADFDDAALDTTGHNCTATRDREHVFYWQQEGAVNCAFWCWDVSVECVSQCQDCLLAQWTGVAFQRQFCRTFNDRQVVAWEFVFRKQLTHFHFNQFQQFCIINHVRFVQEHDDVWNTNLTRQQDVFAGLWHWAVCCGANQDRAVHLRCAGDHVFNIVGVAWAVNVSVVTGFGFVFNVRGVDRDTARFFFWRVIDLIVTLSFAAEFLRQYCRDRSCQCGFTMIDVTNCAHIHVRLGPLEFAFCHFILPSKRTIYLH